MCAGVCKVWCTVVCVVKAAGRGGGSRLLGWMGTVRGERDSTRTLVVRWGARGVMAGSEVSGRWLYCSLWEVGGIDITALEIHIVVLWYCSTVVMVGVHLPSTVYRLPTEMATKAKTKATTPSTRPATTRQQRQ